MEVEKVIQIVKDLVETVFLTVSILKLLRKEKSDKAKSKRRK